MTKLSEHFVYNPDYSEEEASCYSLLPRPFVVQTNNEEAVRSHLINSQIYSHILWFIQSLLSIQLQ